MDTYILMIHHQVNFVVTTPQGKREIMTSLEALTFFLPITSSSVPYLPKINHLVNFCGSHSLVLFQSFTVCTCNPKYCSLVLTIVFNFM